LTSVGEVRYGEVAVDVNGTVADVAGVAAGGGAAVAALFVAAFEVTADLVVAIVFLSS
jgi:hypothetical protein